jgi:hypothetical protein
MKWLLVLISLNLHSDGTADHFIFTNMMYDTVESCQRTAQVNMRVIQEVSIREFNGPSKIYCFRQDRFLDYMKAPPPEPEKKLDI